MWCENLESDMLIISENYSKINNVSSTAGGYDFDHQHYYHVEPEKIRFKKFTEYLIKIFVNSNVGCLTELLDSNVGCLTELLDSDTFRTVMIAYMRAKNIEEMLPKSLQEYNIKSNEYYSNQIGFNIQHLKEYLRDNNTKEAIDTNIFLLTSYCLMIVSRVMIYYNSNNRLPEWFHNHEFGYAGGEFSFAVIRKLANLQLNNSTKDLNGRTIWLDSFIIYNPMDHMYKLYLLGRAFELI